LSTDITNGRGRNDSKLASRCLYARKIGAFEARRLATKFLGLFSKTVYPSGIDSRRDGNSGSIPVNGLPSRDRLKHKYTGSLPPIFKFATDRVGVDVDDEGRDLCTRTKLNPGGTNSFRSGKMRDIAVTQGRCAARSQFVSFLIQINMVDFLSLIRNGSPLELFEIR